MPAAELKQMKMFKPLSFGWAKGFISYVVLVNNWSIILSISIECLYRNRYGAGLMVEAASGTDSFPPTFSEVGTYMYVMLCLLYLPCR